MKKLIFADDHFGKLHCDNPECGYDLPETLPFDEDLIGFRCPMCGSDMLTMQDFRTASRLKNTIDFINRWFGWLGREEIPDHLPITRITVRDGKVHTEKLKEIPDA